MSLSKYILSCHHHHRPLFPFAPTTVSLSQLSYFAPPSLLIRGKYVCSFVRDASLFPFFIVFFFSHASRLGDRCPAHEDVYAHLYVFRRRPLMPMPIWRVGGEGGRVCAAFTLRAARLRLQKGVIYVKSTPRARSLPVAYERNAPLLPLRSLALVSRPSVFLLFFSCRFPRFLRSSRIGQERDVRTR